MAINKAMRAALRFFSYGGIELKSSRRFANLKAVDWKRPLRKTIHYFIRHKDYDIPVRIFMPDDEIIKTRKPGRGAASHAAVFPWRGMGDGKCGYV